jgi:hypothetical protein
MPGTTGKVATPGSPPSTIPSCARSLKCALPYCPTARDAVERGGLCVASEMEEEQGISRGMHHKTDSQFLQARQLPPSFEEREIAPWETRGANLVVDGGVAHADGDIGALRWQRQLGRPADLRAPLRPGVAPDRPEGKLHGFPIASRILNLVCCGWTLRTCEPGFRV